MKFKNLFTAFLVMLLTLIFVMPAAAAIEGDELPQAHEPLLITNAGQGPGGKMGRLLISRSQAVENYDYNLLFSTIKLDALESKEIPSIISQNKVDGLILAGADINKEMIRAIEELKFPTVLVDNYLRSPIMDSIVSDNFNGAVEAVRYLIKMGHKKIGYAGGPNSHPSFNERYKAYKLELMENNLEINDSFIKIKNDFSQEMGKKLAKEFLQEDKLPTAIFAANDAAAFGVLKELKKRGIKIPEKAGVVGFDNVNFAEYSSPSLTTISRPINKIGKISSQIILNKLKKKNYKQSKRRDITLNVELIKRGSTAERIS